MHTLANSEDQDEMPHNAAFHQGLHCFRRQKGSADKEMHIILKIITCDPLIYTMDYPKSSVSDQKEESISTLRDIQTYQ